MSSPRRPPDTLLFNLAGTLVSGWWRKRHFLDLLRGFEMLTRRRAYAPDVEELRERLSTRTLYEHLDDRCLSLAAFREYRDERLEPSLLFRPNPELIRLLEEEAEGRHFFVVTDCGAPFARRTCEYLGLDMIEEIFAPATQATPEERTARKKDLFHNVLGGLDSGVVLAIGNSRQDFSGLEEHDGFRHLVPGYSATPLALRTWFASGTSLPGRSTINVYKNGEWLHDPGAAEILRRRANADVYDVFIDDPRGVVVVGADDEVILPGNTDYYLTLLLLLKHVNSYCTYTDIWRFGSKDPDPCNQLTTQVLNGRVRARLNHIRKLLASVLPAQKVYEFLPTKRSAGRQYVTDALTTCLIAGE